jgi:putative hydrolase of HD superfamily
MEITENILDMKRLLRTGWIRAGVPKCDIESLADHSWGVAVLTYLLCLQENEHRMRNKIVPLLNTEKAVLMALFHDFAESEYLDIDKSPTNVVSSDKVSAIIQE